jgi:hypothetical protein
VQAATGGVVKAAGPRGEYGKVVEIDHGDGVTTLYAHNAEVLVSKGRQGRPGAGHRGRRRERHLVPMSISRCIGDCDLSEPQGG